MLVHLPPYRVEAVAHALPSTGIDWSISAYGLPALWSRHQGAGVRVGILDTGIDPTHTDLAGAVVGYHNLTKDCTPYDTNGHGTHVAGVVGARGQMRGVAPQCEILSVKVLGNNGTGSLEGVANGVLFALESGCHIIVMSLGAPAITKNLEAAIRKASVAGVTIVCAAGNDGGRVSYPAAMEETIAVGAVDRDGKVCEFSCRGKEIDVAAPGAEITSCWIGGGYATLSGTSMAAPFVGGVLTLAASDVKNHLLGHHARPILKNTSTDVGEPGHDPLYGWGLVNPASVLDGSSKVIV